MSEMTVSIESLFVPALASLDGLVPHERLLTPVELEEVARGLAARVDLWEPLVHDDATHRRYELIYEDDRMDAWILSWMPGQGPGFHDHSISGVGLCVAIVLERRPDRFEDTVTNCRIGQSILNPPAFLPIGDQPGLPQY